MIIMCEIIFVIITLFKGDYELIQKINENKTLSFTLKSTISIAFNQKNISSVELPC